MTMTRERVAALLDGTTPGPWHYRPHKHDDWGVVRGGVFNDEWGGYPHLAQVRDPDKLDEPTLAEHRVSGNDPWEGNARLTAAAPDLARLCLSLMDRLADADVAQAALVERAAEVADANCIYPEGYYGDMPSVAIRAIAPDAGVKNLAALRAERDDLRHLTAGAESINEYKADNSRLAAELAEARKQVEALRRLLKKCRPSVANMAYGWPEDDELVKEIDAALTAAEDGK